MKNTPDRRRDRIVPKGKPAAALCLLAVLLTVSTTACSPRQWMVREVSHVLESGIDSFDRDEDLVLIQQALPANIKLLETLLVQDPGNEDLSIALARLYGSYSFMVAEKELEAVELGRQAPRTGMRQEEMEAAVRRYYGKGMAYALGVLEKRHPGCAQQLGRLPDADGCFQQMTAADLPALYWYGFNLGAFVNRSRGSVRALSQAHLAEKAMIRVLEIDPSYYHGGAHLFLLAYYGSRPPMMGGRPDAAQAHYREVKSLIGDDFLLADLFYARHYLQPIQDRKGFHEMLETVLHYPVKPGPHRLLDQVAIDRAALYLDAEERLFP